MCRFKVNNGKKKKNTMKSVYYKINQRLSLLMIIGGYCNNHKETANVIIMPFIHFIESGPKLYI